PGSRSRAHALDRLRTFLEGGVTCFVDLTEPGETGDYDMLLPSEAPDGRRVEYLREPIPDHGVPAQRETMSRILAMIDGALERGHLVYVHCRAGVGRSATVAGCWLAERAGGGDAGLAELQQLWPQAGQSMHWPTVPETPQQAQFVRDWPAQGARAPLAAPALRARPAIVVSLEQRVRGGWLGLALGDALGAARVAKAAPATRLEWTQHTALALCSAHSLLELGRFDARDQIERFVRWQREGYCTASGTRIAATADVTKAIATFLWRRLPMAGSHDPTDMAPTSLPRVLAAVACSAADPGSAIALAAECSRTTHQSPVILDACRLYAAMLAGTLQGVAAHEWARGVPAGVQASIAATPRHEELRALVAGEAEAPRKSLRPDVGGMLQQVRSLVLAHPSFDVAVDQACRTGRADAALLGALVGAWVGMQQGADALPQAVLARLAGVEQLESVAARCLERARAAAGGPA
ncbi:MAG: ADP-ribosylglycohydrolase family protein, partial [Steroidobacteraceae bacterium]